MHKEGREEQNEEQDKQSREFDDTTKYKSSFNSQEEDPEESLEELFYRQVRYLQLCRQAGRNIH